MDSVGRAVPDVWPLYMCSGVTWPSGTHPLKNKKQHKVFKPTGLFLGACIHTHTQRSRKEENQGLPCFTETLGDCCHLLFPMWVPVVWLQEPGEDFSPVTHYFCFPLRHKRLAYSLHMGCHSILGDATSCMED